MRRLQFSLRWLALLYLITTPAGAATNVVTTLADSGPGSLRCAISNALTGDTIIVATNGTIGLTSGELLIQRDLNIVGPGATNFAVSGSTAFRVFEIGAGVVTMRGLTITNGYTISGPGAGILNAGTLTLIQCVIINNKSIAGTTAPYEALGGGLANYGNATILSSTLVGNSSLGYDYSHGTGSGENAKGGGIYMGGATLAISNSMLSGNVAVANIAQTLGFKRDAFGGGIFMQSGQASIVNSSITSNSAWGSTGYSVFTSGSPGTFGFGGGIYLYSGIVTCTGCTISANGARGGSGGFGSHYGGNGGNAYGGGIWSSDSITLVNCTISGNTATGGGGGNGYDSGSNGGNGYGGGVHALNGALSLTNCTLYQNSATGGLRGSGIGVWYAGKGFGFGLYGTTNSVTFINTILQKDSGAFSSLGHNLLEGTTNLVPTDIAISVLTLNPLQDNGGPTFTHELPSGSAAIDGGTLVGTPPFDQRGVIRPQGAAVDIGAFELLPLPPSPRVTGLRRLSNGVFQFKFTNLNNKTWSVLATTNVALPSTQWLDLGPATLISNSLYQFSDTSATSNRNRFFRLRWP